LASGQISQSKCLILDITMPGMSGHDLLEELKRLGWEPPVNSSSLRKETRTCARDQAGVIEIVIALPLVPRTVGPARAITSFRPVELRASENERSCMGNSCWL
jgi:CheY-like chemotaxis protein